MSSSLHFDENLVDLQGQDASQDASNASVPSSTTNSTTESNSSFYFILYSIYDYVWNLINSIPPEYQRWLALVPSLCMIVGACMPYIPQYITIYKNKNHKGFSTFGKRLMNFVQVFLCFLQIKLTLILSLLLSLLNSSHFKHFTCCILHWTPIRRDIINTELRDDFISNFIAWTMRQDGTTFGNVSGQTADYFELWF